MNDTSPEMESRYRIMIMERSGEERLKMGRSTFEAAKALMQAGILGQNPYASLEFAALCSCNSTDTNSMPNPVPRSWPPLSQQLIPSPDS